ncbi:MAG: hypothetical protein LBC83_08405 [Oscillospiraceae bacterium]|jgi:hypothetical protein|nr:hypothetical protein [Oscillospiraceae bacterium]
MGNIENTGRIAALVITAVLTIAMAVGLVVISKPFKQKPGAQADEEAAAKTWAMRRTGFSFMFILSTVATVALMISFAVTAARGEAPEVSTTAVVSQSGTTVVSAVGSAASAATADGASGTTAGVATEDETQSKTTATMVKTTTAKTTVATTKKTTTEKTIRTTATATRGTTVASAMPVIRLEVLDRDGNVVRGIGVAPWEGDRPQDIASGEYSYSEKYKENVVWFHIIAKDNAGNALKGASLDWQNRKGEWEGAGLNKRMKFVEGEVHRFRLKMADGATFYFRLTNSKWQ